MNKEELQKFIDSGLSTRSISKITNKSQTSIRYWLSKYSIENKKQDICKCSCGETIPEKFYGNKKSICASCHNLYTIKKGIEKRLYALDKLGGKCVNCGYCEFTCSLDIHHLDPKIKDVNFSSFRGWTLKRIDKEIENCVLLCKNCHSAYHSGYINLNIIENNS